MTKENNFLPYTADIDIIRFCHEKGFPVKSHPFFRDMEKRWPFVLCELKNATVLGETFTPICQNELLYDCLSFFGPKQLKKTSQGGTLGERRVFNVEKAFLLGGDRTFGHVISAILMRTLYLQLFDHLKDLPVITMAGMPTTCYELFGIFGCPMERLILLEENDAIECGELYVPTVAGGIPPEGDTWSIPTKLTHIYHDLVIQACGGPASAEPTRAVYLVRGSTTKTKLVRNDDEVIDFMAARGYEIVDPGTMSLQDQVRLAQETKFYVASMGSQLHIADFAQSGSQIILFSSQDTARQRSFDAVSRWFDIGVPVMTLICAADESNNLSIDLNQLEEALRKQGFPC